MILITINFFFKVEKNIDKQHVFEKKHIFISNPFSSILDAEIDFPRSYFHSGNSLCQASKLRQTRPIATRRLPIGLYIWRSDVWRPLSSVVPVSPPGLLQLCQWLQQGQEDLLLRVWQEGVGTGTGSSSSHHRISASRTDKARTYGGSRWQRNGRFRRIYRGLDFHDGLMSARLNISPSNTK